PGGTAGGPGQGQDGGVPADAAAAQWVPVRVYNNSTIHGLAARAADELKANGWNVVEVGNYPSGIIPTTTAYYTPGTDEETAARALATAFGMKVEPRFQGIEDASPGVIVIVTNDYQGSQVKGS
ncbi:LytR C-terminal domain-containing protein, partial [Amycolatopsis endophytica]